MKPTTAVLMMAYGGPDSLEDVEPYLLDVRGGRATSPELVEEIRGRYAAIGGKSPLLEITTRQAQALEHALNTGASDHRYLVYVGMRHWHPYIRATVAQIAADGINDLVAICMTPFSSRMSTGAYFEQLARAMDAQTEQSAWREGLKVRKIGAWFAHPTFIQAIAANVRAALADFSTSDGSQPVVLFSAHSLPVVAVEQGDPYADQFEQLASLVAEEAGLPDSQWRTCFQSAGAQSIPWLGPAIEDTIQRLSAEGTKYILSAPIGFLSDHVEVLYDIDLEAQHVAQQCGVTLRRIASLNDQPLFIQALREIIVEEETNQHE
jgi:protoporphyrin/coproporphyrin ferrochelatase